MNKNKTIELTNDYIFKRVFSKKGNEDLLIDLLESILEIKIEKIEVIEEAEIDRININDKVGVIDLKATINNNTIVDIEIQLSDQHNMIMRSMFYTAGLYHTGLKAGEKYEANKKVIGINILKYNIFKWKKYHSKITMKEKELNIEVTDMIEIHFIELPKFLKSKNEGSKKLRQWMEFICNEREGKIEMAVKENKKIAKAKEEYEYLTGDEAVQRLAFLRDKWERDHNSDIAWEREEARKQGLNEGRKIGRKAGEKAGRIEGKSEERKKIIKEMLKKEFTEETIIEITKISKKELEKIKEEIKEEIK